MFKLKNKVVLISGSNGQLGRALCKVYKEQAAKVVGVDINIAKGRVGGVTYYALDITKPDEVNKTFSRIVKQYKTLDILINNAGVSVFAPFEKRSEKELDWVMDVNLKGTFFCIQAYAKLLAAHKLKRGSIVNIASFYGVISPDYRIYTDCSRRNSEIYGATKAGIIQMTKYFAVHLAKDNIRVNAVSPGGIFNPQSPQGKDFIRRYSDRCPMGRMARVSEITGAVLYLSGEAASYTTGHNLIVDGGMSCW